MVSEKATRWRTAIFVAILGLWPTASGAATEDNFNVRTSADLVALCSSPSSDEMHVAALHFCEGYVVGAAQYHNAQHAGSGTTPMYCLPNPPPSREAAIAMFVSWAQSNPQYMSERAVDSFIRFAAATWPCRK